MPRKKPFVKCTAHKRLGNGACSVFVNDPGCCAGRTGRPVLVTVARPGGSIPAGQVWNMFTAEWVDAPAEEQLSALRSAQQQGRNRPRGPDVLHMGDGDGWTAPLPGALRDQRDKVASGTRLSRTDEREARQVQQANHMLQSFAAFANFRDVKAAAGSAAVSGDPEAITVLKELMERLFPGVALIETERRSERSSSSSRKKQRMGDQRRAALQRARDEKEDRMLFQRSAAVMMMFGHYHPHTAIRHVLDTLSLAPRSNAVLHRKKNGLTPQRPSNGVLAASGKETFAIELNEMRIALKAAILREADQESLSGLHYMSLSYWFGAVGLKLDGKQISMKDGSTRMLGSAANSAEDVAAIRATDFVPSIFSSYHNGEWDRGHRCSFLLELMKSSPGDGPAEFPPSFCTQARDGEDARAAAGGGGVESDDDEGGHGGDIARIRRAKSPLRVHSFAWFKKVAGDALLQAHKEGFLKLFPHSDPMPFHRGFFRPNTITKPIFKVKNGALVQQGEEEWYRDPLSTAKLLIGAVDPNIFNRVVHDRDSLQKLRTDDCGAYDALVAKAWEMQKYSGGNDYHSWTVQPKNELHAENAVLFHMQVVPAGYYTDEASSRCLSFGLHQYSIFLIYNYYLCSDFLSAEEKLKLWKQTKRFQPVLLAQGSSAWIEAHKHSVDISEDIAKSAAFGCLALWDLLPEEVMFPSMASIERPRHRETVVLPPFRRRKVAKKLQEEATAARLEKRLPFRDILDAFFHNIILDQGEGDEPMTLESWLSAMGMGEEQEEAEIEKHLSTKFGWDDRAAAKRWGNIAGEMITPFDATETVLAADIANDVAQSAIAAIRDLHWQWWPGIPFVVRGRLLLLRFDLISADTPAALAVEGYAGGADKTMEGGDLEALNLNPLSILSLSPHDPEKRAELFKKLPIDSRYTPTELRALSREKRRAMCKLLGLGTEDDTIDTMRSEPMLVLLRKHFGPYTTGHVALSRAYPGASSMSPTPGVESMHDGAGVDKSIVRQLLRQLRTTTRALVIRELEALVERTLTGTVMCTTMCCCAAAGPCAFGCFCPQCAAIVDSSRPFDRIDAVTNDKEKRVIKAAGELLRKCAILHSIAYAPPDEHSHAQAAQYGCIAIGAFGDFVNFFPVAAAAAGGAAVPGAAGVSAAGSAAGGAAEVPVAPVASVAASAAVVQPATDMEVEGEDVPQPQRAIASLLVPDERRGGKGKGKTKKKHATPFGAHTRGIFFNSMMQIFRNPLCDSLADLGEMMFAQFQLTATDVRNDRKVLFQRATDRGQVSYIRDTTEMSEAQQQAKLVTVGVKKRLYDTHIRASPTSRVPTKLVVTAEQAAEPGLVFFIITKLTRVLCAHLRGEAEIFVESSDDEYVTIDGVDVRSFTVHFDRIDACESVRQYQHLRLPLLAIDADRQEQLTTLLADHACPFHVPGHRDAAAALAMLRRHAAEGGHLLDDKHIITTQFIERK